MKVFRVTGEAWFKNGQANNVDYLVPVLDGNQAQPQVEKFLNQRGDLASFEIAALVYVGQALPVLPQGHGEKGS